MLFPFRQNRWQNFVKFAIFVVGCISGHISGLELNRRQLQLQHDQEQLKLRAKISEVEAEERVYQMFEEKGEVSDHTSAVNGPVKESPLNPNAAEWPACIPGDVNKKMSGVRDLGADVEANKNMSGVQDLGADAKANKEMFGAQVEGANVEVEGHCSPVKGKEQQVSPNASLCDEPRLLQMINIMQLPKAELMTVSGDPLEFWMFMHSFDNSIGSVAIDDSAKLSRLFQYCKGEALKVIKCCAVMKPSEGYVKARVLLKERFGNDYKISEMWVKTVTEGPYYKTQ